MQPRPRAMPRRQDSTPASRRSFVALPESLVEKRAELAEIAVAQRPAGHQLGREEPSLTVEQLLDEPLHRACLGGLARDAREISKRPPLLLVPDEALLLEDAEHGEHGVVRELVGQP